MGCEGSAVQICPSRPLNFAIHQRCVAARDLCCDREPVRVVTAPGWDATDALDLHDKVVKAYSVHPSVISDRTLSRARGSGRILFFKTCEGWETVRLNPPAPPQLRAMVPLPAQSARAPLEHGQLRSGGQGPIQTAQTHVNSAPTLNQGGDQASPPIVMAQLPAGRSREWMSIQPGMDKHPT